MRMRMWTVSVRWVPLLVVLATVAAPRAAEAQRRRGGPPNREEIEQRIRAQMGRMMRQRLGLDEDQAERLSEVVRSFDGQRRELAERELGIRRQVEELMDGDGDQDRARTLLEQQADLRMQEAELFRAEQEALLQVLSPEQVLELQDLRQDVGRRIRALRGRNGPDGGRFRGPGPRPGPDGADRDGRVGVRPMRPPGPPPVS